MVSAFSSGTGMSGVLGSALYIGLSGGGMTFSAIFMLLNVFVLIYLLVYFVGVQEPRSFLACELVPSPSGDRQEQNICSEARQIHRLIFRPVVQLFMVYVFEYAVQMSAGFEQPCSYHGAPTSEASDPVVRGFYPLTQFVYQLGVLVSRSSLSFWKIKRVHILTWFQALNMIVWLLLAKTKWLGEPPLLYLMIPMMLFVGLLGGASYVNVLHIIRTDEKVSHNVELAMNVAGIYFTLGICGGSLVDLLFVNTVLKSEVC
eukprot:TRINITY_DN77679_c0_g1_i1.p1 TRINITY_DN77679_c0_g1~~TRINITY_DN77679_c0_g1_i1.p1  ORF type:complete len:298 (-),score=30.31 TRINITY_DN77679_c0_g1_i1:160-936(-)